MCHYLIFKIQTQWSSGSSFTLSNERLTCDHAVFRLRLDTQHPTHVDHGEIITNSEALARCAAQDAKQTENKCIKEERAKRRDAKTAERQACLRWQSVTKCDGFCSNSGSEHRVIQHRGTTDAKNIMVLQDSSYDILFPSENDWGKSDLRTQSYGQYLKFVQIPDQW